MPKVIASGTSALARCGVVIAALAAAVNGASASEGAGSIRGRVVDHDLVAPLVGAKVTVTGTVVSALTSEDGYFLLEDVPAGAHTLVITKEGYERQIVPDVAVSPGRITEVSVELTLEVVEMEEMLAEAAEPLAHSEAGLLEIRATAVTLQDSISAELIAKAGVSDVAGALKLVVGATVVGGKYASVRGLSDRYTGTTLNGLRVPSPDPRLRAVQVDLFPTGTLESVTVSKTFTPDLQGDFTGGAVDIETKSVPEHRTLRISLSTQHDSSATGNDRFLTYTGGGIGSFPAAGSDRRLPVITERRPPAAPSARTTATPEQIADAQFIDRYTRAFAPVMGVSREAPGPGSGLSVVGGGRREIAGGGVLGWLAALTTSRKHDFYQDGVNNKVGVSDPDQPMAVTAARVDSAGVEEVLVGAVANAEYRPSDRHAFSLRVVANRGAEDEARLQTQNVDGANVDQNQSLHYTERTLLSPQIRGRHSFPGVLARKDRRGVFRGLDLDWAVAADSTRQYEPDVRFFLDRFNLETGTGFFAGGTNDVDRTRRIFRDITERDRQVSANLALPFRRFEDSEGRLKFGLYVNRGVRDYEQRSFSYSFQSQFRGPTGNPNIPGWEFNNGLSSFSVERDCAGGACGPDLLWTDVFLQESRIGLARNDPPSPNQLLWYLLPLGTDVDYSGDQRIEAAYAMVELPLTRKVKLVGGARWEDTRLSVDPVNPIQDRVPVIVVNGSSRGLALVSASEAAADVSATRWLPSLGVIWEVRPGMNLRSQWSRTLARPTFRELAPVATEEFLSGDEFIGNPALLLPAIENRDVRWEWIRGEGDVLALSLFTKSMENPIEYISFGVANRSFVQPVNYQRGRVRGIELEARQALGPLWRGLAGVTVGANYTQLRSHVDAPQAEQESLAAFGLQETRRALQGQPASLENLNVTYDHERSGTSLGLFWNRVGETLLTGAARGVEDGTPNVFDAPHGSFDVAFSRKLKRGLAVGAQARNLSGAVRRTFYRRPSGETVTKTERSTGQELKVSLSWAW